ncbi:MAG: glycosyltransferase [Planctomycetaceae bacterium]
MPNINPVRRIAFVSTRIAGTDGVSLEIGKWTDVLERLGFECRFISGGTDRPADQSVVIDEANFQHPTIAEINAACFGRQSRSREMSALIRMEAASIKNQLYDAVEALKPDLIIAENALTLPVNIPLGIALDEFLVESQIPCIAHHHDFVWERERYFVNAVDDYLTGYFPPRRADMEHVVINSVAGGEFSRRTGLPYHVIPNVMDFDNPPPADGDHATRLRSKLGFSADDVVILQPTRVVARKGIEHTIELVRRLDDPRYKLMISHGEDDEGPEYPQRVREYGRLLGVDITFAGGCIGYCRDCLQTSSPCYSIWDAYRAADLVAYPSTYEGFGNAFLEAVFFRKPVFCNRYTIFRTDIEPCGFRTIAMDAFLTESVIEETRRVLEDADVREEMVTHNYEVGRRLFSYRRVAEPLQAMLRKPRQLPPGA